MTDLKSGLGFIGFSTLKYGKMEWSDHAEAISSHWDTLFLQRLIFLGFLWYLLRSLVRYHHTEDLKYLIFVAERNFINP